MIECAGQNIWENIEKLVQVTEKKFGKERGFLEKGKKWIKYLQSQC